jgi:hypothetical protein
MDHTVNSELWTTASKRPCLHASVLCESTWVVCLVKSHGQPLTCEHVSHRRHLNHVQEDDENDRFYAQAELILTQDVSHAQLELKNVNSSVHATLLVNAKAGGNAFDISGNGTSPFKVGDTIEVTCFEKGEVP